MIWDEATIKTLRDLWAEGLSVAEIGRRMGCSKNAIAGKAHRLDLGGRQSPIIRKTKETTLLAEPVKNSLPPLPSIAAEPPAPTPATKPAPAPVVMMPRPQPAPAPQPQPEPATVFKFVQKVRTCCFPIGEPRTKGFRFCDKPANPEKPYCDEHCELAYIPFSKKHRERSDERLAARVA